MSVLETNELTKRYRGGPVVNTLGSTVDRRELPEVERPDQRVPRVSDPRDDATDDLVGAFAATAIRDLDVGATRDEANRRRIDDEEP